MLFDSKLHLELPTQRSMYGLYDETHMLRRLLVFVEMLFCVRKGVRECGGHGGNREESTATHGQAFQYSSDSSDILKFRKHLQVARVQPWQMEANPSVELSSDLVHESWAIQTMTTSAPRVNRNLRFFLDSVC